MPGFYKVCFLSVAILAQGLKHRPPAPTLDADSRTAMSNKGGPYNGKGMGNRRAAANAEIAEAWASGAHLAGLLATAEASLATAKAATAAAEAATAAAEAATIAAEAATVKADARAKEWKDMYDELLSVLPPAKRS